MAGEVLMALAQFAGQTVAAAAITDVWESVRGKFARLLGRGDARKTEVAEKWLAATREQLTASAGPGRTVSQRSQASRWTDRFADLLDEDPGIEGQLRALLAEVAAQLPAPLASAADHSLAAGQDVSVSASGGSIAAGVLNVGGAGASVTVNVGGPAPGSGASLTQSASAGVLVVGDVPQEPAAFQLRADLMEALGRRQGGRVSVVHAVTGIRGVGKSQAAAAYARQRITGRWRLVAWVDASTRASVLTGLAQIAVAAALGTPDEDAVAAAARVRRWLEADGDRRLLVFDNATDLDELRPFIPSAGASQVVVTSNRQSAAGLGTGIAVDVFTEAEALAYLAERTRLDDPGGARQLAGDLGFLPLGLAQAAALIARQHLTYATYLQRLRDLPLADYLGRLEGDAYPYKTAEAIVLSLLSVREADSSGRADDLMGLVSVLAETGISRRLLHLSAAGEEDTASREAELDAAAGLLADLSLTGFSLDDSVVAHRLVMRAVREYLGEEGGLASAAAAATQLLERVADQIPEAWQDPAAVRELAGHVSALTRHAGTSADEAAMLLPVMNQSVYLLTALGDSTGLAIEAAEPLTRDCEQLLGTRHPETLTARNNLAYAYQAAGRLDEAVSLFERTLADREATLGDAHPATLDSRNNLGSAYGAAGRLDDAISLFERTLADRERILGATHPDTLTSRSNLAGAYEAAGWLEEAIPLHERTVADFEHVLGDTHPDTLTSRNNLAHATYAAGWLEEAIPLFEQILADREETLGDIHPRTLDSRNNLGSAYEAAGRLDDAISVFERTLADRERVQGDTHPATLTSRSNLACAYQAAGRLNDAIPLHERTLADREETLGGTHPDTLVSRSNLASAYQTAGRLDEAEKLRKRARPAAPA
ncbi:MAG TPA: FxSxx-COOH system tetratricopeptide repeat protein [Streptosporangiaceae bacterium]|nr:FxSxx-COOH system tetratricopeptide repeat protein [Streptosporangiaceae bacterium]